MHSALTYSSSLKLEKEMNLDVVTGPVNNENYRYYF